MIFSRKRQPQEEAYPAVPNTLRSDSVEIAPEIRKTQQARADTAADHTPYLGLRARLSQLWLNRWTILLLLVLLRVMLSIAGINEDVDEANRKALSACTKVEDVGSAMASMPHYLSVGVNEMSAQGIERTMDGLVSTLGLVLTGIQGLIMFVIKMVTEMYLCLIMAFVNGGLEVASAVTEKATEALNSAIGSIADELEDSQDSLESGLNKVKDAIEDSFIGGAFPDMPDVDLSGPISDIKDLEIDTSDFVSDIEDIKDDLPDFKDIYNATAEALAVPFRLIKDSVDEAYKDFRFDRSVFPVAEKQALNFCSDNNTISDFFDLLRDMIRTARIIFIVVLSLLAILVIAPMAWYEIMRWRRQQEHARLVGEHSYDPMDVVYIASRPTSASWGIKFASKFSGKRQILARWAWAYGTSLPALFVLALALAGLFSCACQAILLKTMEDQVPKIADHVGQFADEVVGSLAAVSQDWADSANGVVTSTQDDINDELLGWAREGTSAVNETLDTFIELMNDGLETIFNDTVLIDPIKEVVYCTVGLKVEAVQKGLTWVHDNAKVSFPTFANDTFSAGAEESISDDSDMTTFLSTPSSVTTDEVTGAVQYVVDKFRSHIIKEALISTGILLVYIICVLVGVIYALVNMAMPDKGRAEGGMKYTGDDRAPVTPRSAQNGQFQHFGNEQQGGYNDGYYAYDGRDEKGMASVPGGRVQQMHSPTRTSSYGQFESTGKH